ncbi:MAG: hypothetical protein BWX85_00128 [Chloroflexi bacterium ADurb.Bin120]|jgi:hypothetical protein|uniref:Pappalysin-1 SD scarf domain-containing protein n=1 Tax=Candidatus Brevifilum fermentans TaxID=1986204 RepID=A0A1Y6K3G7_9CHLR|nr:hypothetical protein [Brevefilum fermentans]OQB87949.1 MAG: hypothetical protein BWX85_00128 [Chloroflexi bacterium ADurb.Bin120]SMX53387.1 exported protein of unknown function [Brevefilum fermentans]HOM67175.1 hypothetical protein [Brevefilum fermentans]
MIKKHYPLILIITMLLIATLACSLGGKKSPKLGETYRSEAGGYSLQQVPGYDFEEFWGMTMMSPTDADERFGPMIMAYGLPNDDNLSLQGLMDEMTQQDDEVSAEYSKPKKTKVGGVEGLLVEFKGIEDGQKLKGKLFVALPYPEQTFYMTVLSPEDRWKEIEPIYDAVLKSVSFFEADLTDLDFDLEDFEFDLEDFEFEEEIEGFDETLEDILVPSTQVIRQWAVLAEASSEYSSDDYSALQATGAPDVDYCEENPLAWAPLSGDTEEYLVLYYDVPVIPTELVIIQSHNPSQVVEIQFIDTDGETWTLWYGEPERISTCPDEWTHTIELDEVFYTDTVVIWVDQSVLGLGWAEIDAVELVGYPMGSTSTTVQEEPEVQIPSLLDIPENFSGLMAGPVYQGYASIVIGETKEADLDRIMTIAGRESTDSWKPRESHKQTYLYDMPWSGMTAYISVTVDGVVYKKNVTSGKYPDDYALPTVNNENYEILKGIYDRDKVIPYEVMANLLQSPGFIREQWLREDDGKIVSTYFWHSADGYVLSGIFYDGLLTGMAGLSYYQP